ncbi:unnamed protein product [Closterium sp. Yama58-4]|nr:unnamed protein product [Closterium sp. Yama58-4]
MPEVPTRLPHPYSPSSPELSELTHTLSAHPYSLSSPVLSQLTCIPYFSRRVVLLSRLQVDREPDGRPCILGYYAFGAPARVSGNQANSTLSALGLSFVTWSPTATPDCAVDPGQRPSGTEWESVYCSTSGDVTFLELTAHYIVRKDLPSDLTALAALTSLKMNGNLLDGNMGKYLKYLTGLSALQTLNMASNFFSGQFPSFLLGLTSLTALDLSYNALTGSLPSTITKLKSLILYNNFLVGSLPSNTWTECWGYLNCLSSVGTCGSAYTAQRSSADCAICGSTDGTGTLCNPGESCEADSDARISSNSLNVQGVGATVMCKVLSSPLIEATQVSALVAIKSAMDLTSIMWSLTTTPSCAVDVSTSKDTDWRSVMCSTNGDVVFMDLSLRNIVRKDLPSDLTKLSALTYLTLSNNLLDGNIGNYLKYVTGLSALRELYIYGNYFSGQFPSFLLDSTSLTALDLSYNYLTGSLPSTITKLNTDGTGTLCSPGELCKPDADASIASLSVNMSPEVELRCIGVSGLLMEASQANAMMALKAALGVTLTTWASTNLCRITEKTTALSNEWTGVFCNLAGSVESISVGRQSLKGSIASDITKLTALTYLDFGFNLFQGALNVFLFPMNGMTSLKALFLSYNWFYGTIPTIFASLPQLTTLGLYSNYLTGTMPIPSTTLVGLDVGLNYLSGSFPQLSLKSCSADCNCFLSSSYCRSSSQYQRSASDCAICGSADGQGELCYGGLCGHDSADAVSAGTVNSPALPMVPMKCLGSPVVVMDTASAYVLLSVKSSLGVTDSTWVAASPCTIGQSRCQPPRHLERRGLLRCWGRHQRVSDAGNHDIPSHPPGASVKPQHVSSILLPSWAAFPQCLRDLSSNLFRQNLASFTSGFSKLQALKRLLLNNNWFAGSIPFALVSLPTLTYLDLHTNALTGTVPALPTSLLSLDIQDNFLAGSFPTASLKSCDASSNCLASAMACSEESAVSQRDADTCSFCESQDGTGLLCFGGSCLPDVDNSTVHDDGMDPPDMYCIEAPVVTIHPTDAQALLAVKGALGVTFTTWGPDMPCTTASTGPTIEGTLPAVSCDPFGRVRTLQLKRLNLAGSLPRAISNLTALTYISVAFNYLTGSLPTALPTTLASLDVQSNFLVGSVPANSIAYCVSTCNCLVDASKCASLGLAQRSAAECAVCGSTNGQGTLCANATTCRVAAAGAGVTTLPTALSASLPLFCEAIPMDLNTTQTMVAIKAALGVTLTDWTATLPLLKPSSPTSLNSLPRSSSVPLAESLGTCTLEGQTPGPGAWTGVYCSSKGVAVGIDLSSNPFQRRLDVFLSLVSTLKALQNLHLHNNWFSGSIPSSLVALSALSTLATNCANAAGTAQRAASECSVCGSTDASGVLCGGGLCASDASAPAASSTPNTDGQPLLPLSCLGVPMDAAMGLALLSVKASLGVTFTDWNVDAPCALAGQAVVPGSWSSVVFGFLWSSCSSMLTRSHHHILTSSRVWAVPCCTCVGCAMLHVCGLCHAARVWAVPCCSELNNNLFSGRLDSFLTPLLPVKTLKVLHVHNNYLSGAVPPSLTAFSALSELKIQANYLTGSMPAALPASLKYLDASGNYLVGTFPTTTTTYCSCASNCFTDSTKCINGTTQRAADACSICSSTNGTGVLCSGGTCAPSSTALIAAKTVNTGTAEMYCAGAPMDATMAAALLSVKASLGVSFTDWAVSSPCAVQGVAAPPGAWANVLCDSTFKPVSLKLSGLKLTGRMHSDISKLTTLTSIDLRSNLLQGRLDVFTTNFKALTSLKQAYFDFNWFSASIPSALVGIASLTSFGASYNYLYGPVPKLGTAPKTIDLQKNWLSGTFPGTGFLSCSASSNCLANIGTCNTTGTKQRPLASCSVCDSLKGTDPICAGGTCAPNTAGPLATFTTPTASSPILPRFCVGVPLSAAEATILLSVKTALGVTFTEWSASTIAAKARTLISEISNKPKALNKRRLAESEARRERVLLVAPPSAQAGMCTIQGQTPVPGSWPGVFCSSDGVVVGL